MQTQSPSHSRTMGALLMVTTLLSAVVMAHHPHVSSPDLAVVMQQISDLAEMSSWVHGILIALMLTVYLGLTEFALLRGVERPLVRAGLIAYGAGMVAMLGAATIDGFITPYLPELLQKGGDQDPHVIAALINYSSLMNRSLADIGVIAMSAGIVCWSVGLMHSAGWPRIVGVLGILVGLSPAIGLLAGGYHLNMHGMLGVVLVQAIWNMAVGGLMVAGKVRP